MNKYRARRIGLGCFIASALFISFANNLDVDVAETPVVVMETTAMCYEPDMPYTSIDSDDEICPICGNPLRDPVIDLSDVEVEILSRVVEGEAAGEGQLCKKAVASVVINRMNLEGKDLYTVVMEEDQFAVADILDTIHPSTESYQAVHDVMYCGCVLPAYVTYFRAGQYHDWGDQMPYISMDDTYFSYSAAIRDSILGV